MKLNTASTGPLATRFFPHPLDENVGITFYGHIYTRYVAHKRGGVIGEWRLITSYKGTTVRGKRNDPKFRTSIRERVFVSLPLAFTKLYWAEVGFTTCSVNAGRFALECYTGRRLEVWEVCRHGIAGPNDHSYLNVSPGDAVNNMIDDLENGKSETSLTYLIQAQNRISRLISGLTSTKPTN